MEYAHPRRTALALNLLSASRCSRQWNGPEKPWLAIARAFAPKDSIEQPIRLRGLDGLGGQDGLGLAGQDKFPKYLGIERTRLYGSMVESGKKAIPYRFRRTDVCGAKSRRKKSGCSR